MNLEQLEIPFTTSHSELHFIYDAVILTNGLHEVEDIVEAPLQSEWLHQATSNPIILS